ncbi:GGDEF domain-containing protein [Salinivibrio sp. ES.052]|uniref:GGDEF domain-containing protein n=1 Tax=Salinivibrio sp. ES.052 TaxID=1882823 RepID=UPI00092C7914|nr:GGDEF domain-containing protein [Salinivibrio sp. ES.052]SIO22762.1 diguanylate cyclase (GGDEF) domain-containing protein [Salinivibrio sp. ES.052]
MLASLNPILSIGLTDHNQLMRHQIRMTNLLTLICVVGTLIFSTMYWLAFQTPLAAWHNLVYGALYALTWGLMKAGRWYIARYYLFFVFFAQQFIMSYWVFAAQSQNELLLLVSPTIVLLLFEPHDRIARYGLSITAIVLMFSIQVLPSPDPLAVLSSLNAKTIYLSVVLVFIALSVILMDFYLHDLYTINQQARQSAQREPLAQTWNATQFYRQVNARQHSSPNKPMALLCINLDHFHQFNANYGHKIGDESLQFIARVLKRHLPDNAILSRTHADQFLVMLVDNDCSCAPKWAVQCQRAIADTPFTFNAGAHAFSVSIGIVQHFSGICPFINLIDQACKAMAEAKQAGGNQCVCQLSQPVETHAV